MVGGRWSVVGGDDGCRGNLSVSIATKRTSTSLEKWLRLTGMHHECRREMVVDVEAHSTFANANWLWVGVLRICVVVAIQITPDYWWVNDVPHGHA